MLYILSYPVLGNGDAASIEAYRQVHEPARAALVRAHITLVFGVRSITAHDLSSRVAAVAREQAPFEVSFDHAEQVLSPGNVHNIFLLASEGAMALKAMHRELYAGTLSSELLPDLPFRAHMTVATGGSYSGLHERLAQNCSAGAGDDQCAQCCFVGSRGSSRCRPVLPRRPELKSVCSSCTSRADTLSTESTLS
jgi:2'-5' RNA ligase